MANWLVLTLAVVIVVSGAFGSRKRYNGYKVIQVVPENVQTVKFLRNLMLKDVDIDFWSEPSRTGKPVDMMLSPNKLDDITDLLHEKRIAYKVIQEDVQDLLDPMWEDIDRRSFLTRGTQFAFDINDFNRLADIYDWLDSLVGQCRSDVTCEVYTIGTSYEGREIKAFKISKSGANRKAYYMDATTHAREWISTATVLKIINNLATGGDASAVRLVDSYDWYFIPVVNTDGYEYTFVGDRMWRKNRRPNEGSICLGTDLNRNFNSFNWGKEGVSHLPCSDLYCGPSGGSEPEVQAVSQEMVRISADVLAMVTVHSYAYMWLFPWGNSVDYAGQVCQRSDDHDELMRVSDITADAIQSTWNTDVWERGNGCEVIYATTGSTDDFAKDVAQIKYSFTPELRGTSFVIDKSQIEPSFVEVYNGIVAMVDAING